MQTEPSFSEQQSIQLIESMINKARNQFNENGHLYLLWGWVILVCSIGQFVLSELLHNNKSYLVWMVTWLAVIYQLIYLARRKKNRKVRTYTEGILGGVWLSFVITMILFAFSLGNVQGVNANKIFNSFLLALYGVPTFLSGLILRFRPLIIGGICCWCLSVLAPFVPVPYQVLLLGVAVIVAWIIPGYLLRKKYNEVNFE
ncbi:MAG: hypothetical protein INR73_23500 [Williamsia sp.]|nr:hypothetical protein [Williamsia sp.]